MILRRFFLNRENLQEGKLSEQEQEQEHEQQQEQSQTELKKPRDPKEPRST
jgi:hypothetical protein